MQHFLPVLTSCIDRLFMEGSLSYSAGLIRSCGLVVPTARPSMTSIFHTMDRVLEVPEARYRV
jgi:hypothetical protein